MSGARETDSSGIGMQVHALALDADALVRYCAEGDENLVRLLIDKGAEINRISKAGTFPIHEAIKSGNIKCLEVLLEHGADIDVVDESNATTLHYAARYGRATILNALVKACVSRFDSTDREANQKFLLKFINSQSDHDVTPLHEAAKGGKILIFTMFSFPVRELRTSRSTNTDLLGLRLHHHLQLHRLLLLFCYGLVVVGVGVLLFACRSCALY
jgi:hypothetical protein